MSSIIEGYNYDIFISYRQKDNKGDHWVSEFVEALKTELDSTFKEEISVYFDINPHDGLLETHDVDASLKEKLKCLIFIPIISRTYCDPKSFAWEHEFKVFVEMASRDQFGLKVKLLNNNVASRILPVSIHDLDTEDRRSCESAIGGVLRGIDFIYKEYGVNRPLTLKDSEEKNAYNTNYRNQLNKVALAIKEVINGLSSTLSLKSETGIILNGLSDLQSRNFSNGEIIKLKNYRKSKILSTSSIFDWEKHDKLKISGNSICVAVLPFINLSNDPSWDIWQKGIQEILSNTLSFPEELKVRQTDMINSLMIKNENHNYSSLASSSVWSSLQKLNVDVFVYGNIIKSGSLIRLNVQLIDSLSGEILNPFQVEGLNDEKYVFNLVDSISDEIKTALIISKIGEASYRHFKDYAITDSPEALKCFIQAKNAFFSKFDLKTAIEMYSRAILIDPDFIAAADLLVWAYSFAGMYENAKNLALTNYNKSDQLSPLLRASLNHTYQSFFGTVYDDIKSLKAFLEIEDQLPMYYFLVGNRYCAAFQFDKAIPFLEKALEISDKMDLKPIWSLYYTELGCAYHKTKQLKKEKRLYRKAEVDFPEDFDIIYCQAVLALTENEISVADQYIKKYRSLFEENSLPESNLLIDLADIYCKADMTEQAADYYRQAIEKAPDNSIIANKYAYFLIDKEVNISEGLAMINKVLLKESENSLYQGTKGWGLFKQGNVLEAIDILQKS